VPPLLLASAALHALLMSGDGTAAAERLADMTSEVQRAEPNNAALMVQLVSQHVLTAEHNGRVTVWWDAAVMSGRGTAVHTAGVALHTSSKLYLTAIIAQHSECC
jgi:hypothetical protein